MNKHPERGMKLAALAAALIGLLAAFVFLPMLASALLEEFPAYQKWYWPCLIYGWVVLLPGFGYGPDKPLLHYARRAAQRGGLAVEAVDYGPLPREEDLACRVRRAFPAAFAAAAAQLDAAAEREEWRDVYLVGKSFGTLIGIPFGLQYFKLAKLALMPFGAQIISPLRRPL